MTAFSYSVKTAYEGPTNPAKRLPRGRLVRIEADVILPADATRAQILEWVKYQMGWGSIDLDNPLSDVDLELHSEPTLTDTGYTTDRLDVREVALEEVRSTHNARAPGTK